MNDQAFEILLAIAKMRGGNQAIGYLLEHVDFARLHPRDRKRLTNRLTWCVSQIEGGAERALEIIAETNNSQQEI